MEEENVSENFVFSKQYMTKKNALTKNLHHFFSFAIVTVSKFDRFGH